MTELKPECKAVPIDYVESFSYFSQLLENRYIDMFYKEWIKGMEQSWFSSNLK